MSLASVFCGGFWANLQLMLTHKFKIVINLEVVVVNITAAPYANTTVTNSRPGIVQEFSQVKSIMIALNYILKNAEI